MELIIVKPGDIFQYDDFSLKFKYIILSDKTTRHREFPIYVINPRSGHIPYPSTFITQSDKKIGEASSLLKILLEIK